MPVSLVDKLNERAAEVQARLDELNAAAAANDEGLSEEQRTEKRGLIAELERINADLLDEDRASKARIQDWRSRQADNEGQAAEFPDGARFSDPAQGPFRHLGEQLQAVARAHAPRGAFDGAGVVDPRLFAAASGHSSGVGADGGFAVQKDFTVDLMKEGFEESALASRCSETEIGPGSDGLEVAYIKETSRATGSRWGGLQLYWIAEADTVTAKKVGMGKWECRLEDLMGLTYATERLLQDATALGGVFQEAFTDEFGFVIDDAIFRGDGAGKPLGLLAAPATVSVAKETGQAADTIVTENIQKIWSRVLPRSKARGVWLTNSECFPQLQGMTVGVGTGGALVYMPPGGLSGSPYGSIYGRPVIEIEQASALGDLGDIVFADLSQYKLIRKGGIQAADSIHVRFLYNERTFRWVARVNGAPKMSSAITPYKGSGTRSAFVTLAERA